MSIISANTLTNSKINIRIIINYGYTKEKSINILDSKNSNGSNFITLPF